MKNILELNEKKVPVVRIDKSLNKYSNVVLFPEKVEKAKQAFKKSDCLTLKSKAANMK
jgi:hypothetical protein